MNTMDFSPLSENEKEYRAYCDEVRQRYSCAWDDTIHQSFRRYLGELEEYSQKLHDLSSEADKISGDVIKLSADMLCSRASDLATKADSI